MTDISMASQKSMPEELKSAIKQSDNHSKSKPLNVSISPKVSFNGLTNKVKFFI